MEQPLKKQQKEEGYEYSQQQQKRKSRKLPSPRELVAHYESQGMDTQEASLKAIQDLQNVVLRMLTSSSSGRNNNTSNDTFSKKLDVINSRLVRMDMKLDSKPGYPQSLAIGVASGAFLQGAGSVFPRVASALSQIWHSVSEATNNR